MLVSLQLMGLRKQGLFTLKGDTLVQPHRQQWFGLHQVELVGLLMPAAWRFNSGFAARASYFLC